MSKKQAVLGGKGVARNDAGRTDVGCDSIRYFRAVTMAAGAVAACAVAALVVSVAGAPDLGPQLGQSGLARTSERFGAEKAGVKKLAAEPSEDGALWAAGQGMARNMLAGWGLKAGQAQAAEPSGPALEGEGGAEDVAPLRPVVSEIVAQGALEIRAFPGLIVPKSEVDLGFQTAGRIAKREVSVGDLVRKDAVLATLDQVTLEQDVEAAFAAVRAAQASADLAAQSLQRVQRLARRGVAAPAQLEAAQAQGDANAAELVAAQADLSRAQDAAKFAVLRAPMDGIVTATQGEEGMGVAAGAVVLTLAAQAGREAVIDVPSEMIALLPPGARFLLRRRAETHLRSPTPIAGQLRIIEPVADANTRSRRLRVTLEDAGADLRLGSLVTAEIDSAANPVLTVPRNALLLTEAQKAAAGVTGIAGPMVWRVTGDPRRAEAVAVTLGAQVDGAQQDGAQEDGAQQDGAQDDSAAALTAASGAPVWSPQIVGRVTVVAGVRAGDEILTRGIYSVHEGMALGERME